MLHAPTIAWQIGHAVVGGKLAADVSASAASSAPLAPLVSVSGPVLPGMLLFPRKGKGDAEEVSVTSSDV